MQFYAAILALAALASAQDYSKLPACARDCFINNFPKSGCSAPTDLVCVCKSAEYNNAVTTCVLGACQIGDALKARQWAVDTCASVGVPI